MKLINGYDLMDYAKKHGYILPAFNTTNLEMTYAIAKGLDDAKLPGYIQISSNNLRLSNPRIIAEIARDAASKYDTPIGLHLDHGKSYEDVKACVDAGFTSIMIDASSLPFEQNVEEVKKAVRYCHCLMDQNLIITNTVAALSEQNSNSSIEKIKNILVETFVSFKHPITEASLNNAIVQLYVALERMQDWFFIEPSDMEIAENLEPEYAISKEIFSRIGKEFFLRIPETEISYFSFIYEGAGKFQFC